MLYPEPAGQCGHRQTMKMYIRTIEIKGDYPSYDAPADNHFYENNLVEVSDRGVVSAPFRRVGATFPLHNSHTLFTPVEPVYHILSGIKILGKIGEEYRWAEFTVHHGIGNDLFVIVKFTKLTTDEVATIA